MANYSFDNTLDELLKNGETRAALFKAIPALEGNDMLTQASAMTFRAIIGFMGGAIPDEQLVGLGRTTDADSIYRSDY